jgi:hypothetical protein
MLLGIPLAVQLCIVERSGKRSISLARLRCELPRVLALAAAPVGGFATFRWLVETPWDNPDFRGGTGPMAHQSLSIPGIDIVFAIQRILAGDAYHVDYFDLSLAVGFLLLAVVGFRKLEIGYAIYALLFILAPLARSSPLFPLMSFPRFVLLLFPCFLVLALWGNCRWLHLSIIFFWILLLCYWAGAFCYGAFVA